MKTSNNPALIDYETVKAGLDELHARRAALEAEGELLDSAVKIIGYLLEVTQRKGGISPNRPSPPKPPDFYL